MEFEKSCAKRDKRFSIPDSVSITCDIPYSKDGLKSHRLDLYVPKNKEVSTLPVIINIHGGGLLLGNKEFNKYFCSRISALGYIVYSIEYRLIPDCNFFDQLDDVSRAMDFINSRIAEDNGDSSHIYAVADSGGAALLLYSCAMIKCIALSKAAQVTPANINIKALGFISGMFYTNRFDKIGLFLPDFLYGKGYKKTPYSSFINPENPDILKNIPPCFLVTSHNDNLRKYTLDFSKALHNNRVSHKLISYPKNPNLTHAFSVFEPFLPESDKVILSMIDFFKKY